jgi:signal recognition particle receptor subunit beta
MSQFDNKHNKIIITGPVGAGKTTAINTISDVAVVHTEAKASDEVKLIKSDTTVAMDFGVIKLDEGNKIHIYGTPGQQRFNFMWDILTKGSIGLIILIDASSEQAIEELKFFMQQFSSMIKETAVAIGLNKTTPTSLSLRELRKHLAPHELNYPIFEIDAREKKDVALLIEALLCTLNPRLNRVSNGH